MTLILYLLAMFLFAVVAPLAAARMRGKTLLGVVVLAASLALSGGLFAASACAPAFSQLQQWLVKGALLSPFALSFGFSLGMLLARRPVPARPPRPAPGTCPACAEAIDPAAATDPERCPRCGERLRQRRKKPVATA